MIFVISNHKDGRTGPEKNIDRTIIRIMRMLLRHSSGRVEMEIVRGAWVDFVSSEWWGKPAGGPLGLNVRFRPCHRPGSKPGGEHVSLPSWITCQV